MATINLIKKQFFKDTMNDFKYVNRIVKSAYKLNKNFFGFDIKHEVRLIYSREEFDKEWGSKTPDWMCAFANNGVVTIFAPSIFEKLTVHQLKHYESTIIHELNHLFLYKLLGTYKPIWLQEGLAMNIEEKSKNGRQYKYDSKLNVKYLFYTYNDKSFLKYSKEFYENSYLATKILFKILGKEKLIDALRKYAKKPTKKNNIALFISRLK